MFSADTLYIPVLLFFLTAAALYDALYRKIPNCLILGALFPGGFLLGPPFLIRLLAVTALFYPCFRLRLTGAGDTSLSEPIPVGVNFPLPGRIWVSSR